MGLGVAECFAAAGIEVVLTDATPDLTRKAKERLVRRARGHAGAGLLAENSVARVEAVETADDVAGTVADADLVFEAVPEDIGLKEEILNACSAAPQDAVIVSNTSSLPINALSEFVGRPGRFCGMHWFNPPEWTPGVEVIPSASTAPEIVGRLVEFLRSIGKRPAVVGDGPGFVANRIQNALFLEAVRCVYEDVLDVLKEGLGDRFEAPDSLRKLVEEGRTGTKSGAGFLEYTDEERERLLLERDRRYAALNKLLEDLPPVDAGSGDSP